MIRKLLSTSLLAALTFGASAYNVDDFVYTNTAKYQIQGANLVVNGKFNQGSTGMDGWIATDATTPLAQVFNMTEGAVNGSNSLKVLPGQTSLASGMYQQIGVDMGGTYVVTIRVLGATAGYTDLDLTGGNTNYINAYFNTDGALATAGGDKNKELSYGENGVNGGYGFSYGTDGFTEVTFAIDAPQGGFIIVDCRGLAEGLEIADVECHLAQNVYDNRIAERRLEYINKYLNALDLSQREVYEDVKEAMDGVKSGLEANVSADEMEVVMQNLDDLWNEFVGVNFENVIDFIPTKDGSANTGNNSANWMKWTSKWQKLNQYSGKAPWTWNTDRWAHNGTTVDSPMTVGWQRNASGTWDNIATLTATLNKGVYFWGVSAEGGMSTLNKERWARSMAKECANVQLFFNGDTTEAFKLSPAVCKDYVYKYEVTEDGTELTLGIRCKMDNNVEGCFTNFYSPVLYKLVQEGELTEEQKAYIEALNIQLNALEGRIELANGYVAEDQKERPWGKEALAEGLKETQSRYDAWKAMTQDDILVAMDNFENIADAVMNDGVRYLNNNYITPFTNLNKPFTDMTAAITTANATKEERIYGSSTMREQLTAKISEAQSFYEGKLVVPFSTEDSLALINERQALEAMVADFKNAIVATSLVDIDFNDTQINTVEDPTGETVTYYTVEGKKGTLVMTDAVGKNGYALGYSGTDSLNMLRVGNSKATVEIAGAPEATESDIVNVKFEYYFGGLTKRYAGFYLMTEEGDTITGLYICRYDKKDKYNPLGIDYKNKINSVTSSNAPIAASSNKTEFNIVIDYGAREIYCTTSGSKGTETTEKFAMSRPLKLAKFVLQSDYSTDGRRCWFDNLKIDRITADATGVTEVAPAEKSVKTDAIYNVAGQRIAAPAKGQIYIQNGIKHVK